MDVTKLKTSDTPWLPAPTAALTGLPHLRRTALSGNQSLHLTPKMKLNEQPLKLKERL